MERFTYKEIYSEDNRKILEINVLPNKCCNFDCIFCPIGRSSTKIDSPQDFEGMDEAIMDLIAVLDQNDVDLVFINAKGEALVNSKINDIIVAIKNQGKSVRLLTNGYLLGEPEYRIIANQCDEVIGEIKVVSDIDFQKVQRPIAGYTLEQHIERMATFNQQYNGTFILELTLMKGYTDSEEAIDKLKEFIGRITPNSIMIERITDAIFVKKLGLSDDVFASLSHRIK